MPAELPQKTRSFSLSIGQLTFGSFLLVLAAIATTSIASVVSIRQIDATFAELQRLRSVGDLAEDIDRRMNELRLAARDFVTDPGTQSSQVGDAAAALGELLKKTRLELAPEQQDMIDGVTVRLSTYRNGIERISALINRRAELIIGLPPLRERFDAAIAETPDPVIASTLFQSQSRIASALLARNPSAAEQAAQSMRALTIPDPKLRTAVDNYAEAIIALSVRERQIADIDKEVLGSEGRLIGRVTELLREVSARRSHVLSRDLAKTLARDKWQSIVLGTAGVLIGLWAAWFVVRRTVRPLAAIGDLDPRAGRRQEGHLDSRHRCQQRDRRYRAGRRSVPSHPGRGRRGARGGGARAGRAAAGRGKLSQAVRRFGRRNLRDDAGRRASQRQPGAGADDGLRHAAGADGRRRRHRRSDLRPSAGARRISEADAARRHGSRVRIPGSRPRRQGALALRQRDRRSRRDRRGRAL